MNQTKWAEIVCPIPGHRKFLWGKEYNTCQSFCHASKKLVCNSCEREITINEKAEQECLNCKKNE